MRTVIRRVRLVPVAGAPAPPGPVDLALEGGVVAEVAPRVDAAGADDVVDADGSWAIPGLWDQHVHMRQWALSFGRLDVSGTAHPREVVRRVAEHAAALPATTRWCWSAATSTTAG